MRDGPRLTIGSFLAVLLGAALLLAAPSARAADACAASGEVRYLCGPVNAEDLVLTPGARFIITSGKPGERGKPGGLYLVDAARMTSRVLVPDVSHPARAPFAACPGPPDPDTLTAHGLALQPGRGGRHTLYAVNHAGRQSVELFDVDARGPEPKLTWIGCVVMPKGADPNSVAPLPGGGLVVSKFDEAGDPKSFQRMIAGEKTGVVYA